MNSSDTRALIDDFFATLGRGDRDHLLELLAADVEWQMPASIPDGLIRGRDRVSAELGSETVRRLFRKGTFRLTIHRIFVDGDTAIVQQGTNAVTKAGENYEMEYCWIYTCSDGRVQHIREYLDTRLAARTLGWD